MFASVAALWSDGAMKSRVMRLGLTSEELREGLDRVATIEPAVARALERVGYPEPRTSAPGYGTLLRTIVGQQVSVAENGRASGRERVCPYVSLAGVDVSFKKHPDVDKNTEQI